MATFFISDLHLNSEQPQITELFVKFITNLISKNDTLYILGDMFETWIGDDDNSALNQQIVNIFKTVSKSGIALYFMQGNRDFLIGKKFVSACGGQLLKDPTVIDLYGSPTLLMHGDLLCTNDQKYLKFRILTHKLWLQKIFLSLPLQWRLKIAKKLRQKSKNHVQQLSPHIMDATSEAIKHYLEKYRVNQLIHGHTHQPTIHFLEQARQLKGRIVLGDWHQTGSFLVCNNQNQKRLMIMK